MSNAQPIVLRAAMKPIATLERPLQSVNLLTKTLRAEPASYQRSDVCAVAAASCVVENVVAFEIARALVDKFGGDSLAEMLARWELFHRLGRKRINT
jgi:chorismate synthase